MYMCIILIYTIHSIHIEIPSHVCSYSIIFGSIMNNSSVYPFYYNILCVVSVVLPPNGRVSPVTYCNVVPLTLIFYN